MENGSLRALSQAKESPLRMRRSGSFAIGAAYARSAESRGSSVGQDYVANAADHHTCAFAVCDGVGQ